MAARRSSRVLSFENFFEDCLIDNNTSNMDFTISNDSHSCDQLLSGRDTYSATAKRSRSPTPHAFGLALKAGQFPSDKNNQRTSRSVSPARGAGSSPVVRATPSSGSDSLVSNAFRVSIRNATIICAVLAALTAGAAVPKLSRMEIDVDYSHMMSRKAQQDLVMQAAAKGSLLIKTKAESSLRTQHCKASFSHGDSPCDVQSWSQPHVQRAEVASEMADSMRLRGGDIVGLVPGMNPLVPQRQQSVMIERGGERLVLNNGRIYRPKLSRTIDID